MTDRICSCCGRGYKDEEKHDYEQCYRDCEERVSSARCNLHNAHEHLDMAKARRQAQREGRIK